MRPLYNNYVRQPVEMFVVMLLVVLMGTIMSIFIIVSSIRDCIVPEEFYSIEIYPTDYEFINFCIEVVTPERGYLLQKDAVENPEMLIEKIEQGVCMFGSYSVFHEKYDSPMLWELQSEDGSINISVQDTLAAARKSAVKYCLIFSSVILIIWGLFLGITYVLYNAPRYPRLVKLIVRKEFLNF